MCVDVMFFGGSGMFEEYLLPPHGSRCTLRFDVGFREIRLRTGNIAAAQTSDRLSTPDAIARLDLNRYNTATCGRENPHDLCGIRLYLCRKIKRLGKRLLYDLDEANRAVPRLVFRRSVHPILTGLITTCQEQRYAESDGRCVRQINLSMHLHNPVSLSESPAPPRSKDNVTDHVVPSRSDHQKGQQKGGHGLSGPLRLKFGLQRLRRRRSSGRARRNGMQSEARCEA